MYRARKVCRLFCANIIAQETKQYASADATAAIVFDFRFHGFFKIPEVGLVFVHLDIVKLCVFSSARYPFERNSNTVSGVIVRQSASG